MSRPYESRELRDTLEACLDRTNLSCVLEALAVVCFEKAAHVAHDWQDAGLAAMWRRAAAVVDRASGHAAVVVLP